MFNSLDDALNDCMNKGLDDVMVVIGEKGGRVTLSGKVSRENGIWLIGGEEISQKENEGIQVSLPVPGLTERAVIFPNFGL